MASLSSPGKMSGRPSRFLKKGLMAYGSIFDCGACLGPYFIADYLHGAALTREQTPWVFRPDSRQSAIAEFKANRYNATSGSSIIQPRKRKHSISSCFSSVNSSPSGSRRKLGAHGLFSCSAWTASTLLPDRILVNEEQIHCAGRACSRIHCLARSIFVNPLSFARGLTRRTPASGLFLNHL